LKNDDLITSIAEALLDFKLDIIITNLVVVCLLVLAVYFHARFKKSGELKEINDNFLTVLKQQEELAEATGKINQSLDKESINYQIRLNAYHDKSIEAINDIYVAIIKLRDAAKDLAFNQSKEEKSSFFKTITEFRSTFDTRKIWIPSILSEHIEDVAVEIDKRANKFLLATTRINNLQGLSEDQMNKIFNEQEQFYDYVYQEMGNIFDKLVEKVSESVRT